MKVDLTLSEVRRIKLMVGGALEYYDQMMARYKHINAPSYIMDALIEGRNEILTLKAKMEKHNKNVN